MSEPGNSLEQSNAFERWLMVQDAVRAHNAGKLRNLVDMLEPMIDGSYGPVAPRMVEVYITALRELGRLYRVFDAPPAPPVVPEELVEAPKVRVEELVAKVEADLRALEGRKG